jgi:hypothetical protein
MRSSFHLLEMRIAPLAGFDLAMGLVLEMLGHGVSSLPLRNFCAPVGWEKESPLSDLQVDRS